MSAADETGDDGVSIPEMRVRVYHAIYLRSAMYYVQIFPPVIRRIHEFLLLAASILCFILLICTQRNLKHCGHNCLKNINLPPPPLGNTIIRLVLVRDRPARPYPYYQEPPPTSLMVINHLQSYKHDYISLAPADPKKLKYSSSTVRLMVMLLQKFVDFSNILNEPEPLEVEFALEYGTLHLSSDLRRRLKIPTLIVEIPADKVDCFGKLPLQLLQEHFIGYQDHLVAAFQFCYDRYGNESRGRTYARIRTNGEMFTFSGYTSSMLWYPFAYILMVLFTLAISLLIRYTHHQIFVLFVELVSYTNDTGLIFTRSMIPIGTAVLALIGIESVITEFFKDTIAAFFIVILVWFADHFYHICCRTTIVKKYWMVFFYLYQFIFYANQIKYNGFFNQLAFLCTVLFIMHSMLFSLNHFELPALLHHNGRERNEE